MSLPVLLRVPALVVALTFPTVLRAWDHTGHQIVNRLALASLPKEFPSFVHEPANADRIVFLANVPDRWRNVDPWLRQSGGSWSDHFIDLEHLTDAGLDPKTVPSLRYDFILIFAAARIAHAQNFLPIDPAKNTDHTQEWPGFAPWAMAEYFNKLRSAFAYLKAYQDVGGTPEEIANAKADAVYLMGVMGHYVGDCAQPLHTTKHFNGWSGPNPNGYTTWDRFHSWIDGGFIAKAKIAFDGLAPRRTVAEPLVLLPRADGRDPFFVAAMDYVLAQHPQVEALYQLEKAGLMGQEDRPITPEARALIEGQLLRGGTMLARVWLTAWQTAPIDAYLRTRLGERFAPTSPPPASGPAAAEKQNNP